VRKATRGACEYWVGGLRGLCGPQRVPTWTSRLPLITLDFMQRHGPLSAGTATIQPALQRYIQCICDLLIAEALGHVSAGFDPQLAQPVADPQRETRVAQVVQPRAFHLGDEIARGAMAQRRIKANGAFAQALIGGAE